MPDASSAKDTTLFYDLQITIEPTAHRLDCIVTIHHPPESHFFLNKDLAVQQVTVDGQPVEVQENASQSLVSPGDRCVGWAGSPGQKLRIAYSGVFQEGSLRKMLEVVSSIRADLVELAIYATWYPRFTNSGGVAFRLVIDLPAAYQVVTNGQLEDTEATWNEAGGARSRTRWASVKPGFDIVIVAAPHLQRRTVSQADAQVEVVFDRLPEEYVQLMGERLLSAMQRYAAWYGSLQYPVTARLIYAPRDAWGYARMPAIIVSEESALANLDDPIGRLNDLHYAAHELAHFWWGVANMNTPDDWINEGLAEYSAYRIVEEVFGSELAGQRVAQYRQHAIASKTDTPIAETTADSSDREVNRYDKVTLLMLGARDRYSTAALDRFLHALHTRFAQSHAATTPTFLDEVEAQIGLEARQFFAQRLCVKWS